MPKTNLPGRLESRLRQNSTSALPVSWQPGPSRADFGLCIRKQATFLQQELVRFNAGRGEALESCTTTGRELSRNAPAGKDLCGTCVWELTQLGVAAEWSQGIILDMCPSAWL